MALVTIDAIGPAIGPDSQSGGLWTGALWDLVAVTMICGIPTAAMYTFIHFFRVRKLRSEERLAAIAPEVDVPMQAELLEAARSPRSGILLVAGAIGYFVTFFFLNGREEPEAMIAAMIAATLGLISLTVGIGLFVDHALIRRDRRTS